MAKFFGAIGYGEQNETSPGVWTEVFEEKEYYGDLTRNNQKLETSEDLNDNITISNIISIVSDPFANNNFHRMRYVVFMGTKWKVKSVDVKYPRLNITTGGVFNG